MIALGNHYVVVVDACVLVPMPLCDTLLRLAEEPALYIPKWSDDILLAFLPPASTWRALTTPATPDTMSVALASL